MDDVAYEREYTPIADVSHSYIYTAFFNTEKVIWASVKQHTHKKKMVGNFMICPNRYVRVSTSTHGFKLHLYQIYARVEGDRALVGQLTFY